MDIEILTGPLKGKRMNLSSGIHLVGRGLGPLPFQDLGLSQEHAKLHVFTHRFEVEDVGSTNGTFVNGERVARRELNLGDEVRLGPESTFRVIDREVKNVKKEESHPYIVASQNDLPARPPFMTQEQNPKSEFVPSVRLSLEKPPVHTQRRRRLLRLIALFVLAAGGVALVYFFNEEISWTLKN